MARHIDPASYAGAVGYVYLLGIPFGVLRPDDRALHETEDALRIAERSSDDVVVGGDVGPCADASPKGCRA